MICAENLELSYYQQYRKNRTQVVSKRLHYKKIMGSEILGDKRIEQNIEGKRSTFYTFDPRHECKMNLCIYLQSMARFLWRE